MKTYNKYSNALPYDTNVEIESLTEELESLIGGNSAYKFLIELGTMVINDYKGGFTLSDAHDFIAELQDTIAEFK